MDDNIVLPPDISRAAREYFQGGKVVTEKFIAKFNMKPFQLGDHRGPKSDAGGTHEGRRIMSAWHRHL